MNAALVSKWGQTPVYGRTAAPPTPPPDGWVQVRVEAVGLHSVVRARASGKHASVSNTAPPHIPGTDGVGRLLHDGTRVYFSTFSTGGGSFCDVVNVPRSACTPLPPDADGVRMAATVNPALSSWMALRKRVVAPPKGFCVLILGVTSASMPLAVEVARALGAARVIGCARDAARMATLGLDQAITLTDEPSQTQFADVHADVVLDYVYGAPAKALLMAVDTRKAPLQYVQLGALAGTQLDLDGGLLRAKDVTMRGSAPGSWSPASLVEELPQLLAVLRRIEVRAPIRSVKLCDVEAVWQSSIGSAERIVFTP